MGLTDEVNRVARLLIAEWERAEGKPVTASYVATFADMARGIVRDRAERDTALRARVRAVLDRMKTRRVDHRHPDEVGYWGVAGRAYYYAGDVIDDISDLAAALTEEDDTTPGPVHNHAPWSPMCNERLVDGQLRGACLNDDGSDNRAVRAALADPTVPNQAPHSEAGP